MYNPIARPVQYFVTLYNALPLSIRNFIGFSLLIFILVLIFRLFWRVKG